MASNVNPANALTALRFPCLPIFWWAVANNERQIATLALLVCALLDVFDGAVARLFNCQTPFGEVFDGLADGICYGFMFVILPAYGWVPAWPVILTVIMGAANIAMRFRYAKRAGRTVNYRSIAMEKMTAYIAYLIGAGVAGFQVQFYFWLYPVMMAVILARDTKRMLIDPIDEVPA